MPGRLCLSALRSPSTSSPFLAAPPRECAAGQAPALLKSSEGGACEYAACGDGNTLDEAVAGDAPTAAPANAAAMAAPAVVLTLAVVAFVEMLMHFC